jgi:hypothetical protein
MSAPTRRVAVIVWAGMMSTPVLFAGVTLATRTPVEMRSPELSGMFHWMAAAVVGLGVALSSLLPPRLRSREQGSPDTVAFGRLLVAWAILEGAAMFPLVAVMVTGDPLLYAICAVAVAALASFFPTERRWRGNAVQPLPSGPSGRTDRLG